MARKGKNIYKRKDGRYEGRYIKRYALDGKAQLGYIYGRNYSEVKERLIKQKAMNRLPDKTISSNLKMSEWFDIWYNNQNHVKQSTKTIYQSYANKHLKPQMGRIKLKRMTRKHIQQFIDELSSELSAKSVKAIYSMLKLCLKSAYDNHLIGIIYDNIRLPKVINKDVKVLTKIEQKRLEKVIESENNPNDIGILICLYTGIRIGELCALKWENINLAQGTIIINKTIYRAKDETGEKKTKLVITTPKSANSEREIPIGGFLLDKLRDMSKVEGYVVNNKGKCMEPATYSRRYKKLLKMAGIGYIKYHSLRHTFAVRALELGVDVKTLSEILGHSSVSTTLNFYGHSLPEHKRSQMELISNLYYQSI